MTPYDQDSSTPSVPVNRMPFILAAIGAGTASLYWFGMTALIMLGATLGSVSPMQLILPCVLIGLYAWRAIQISKGDSNAARRVIWLHGIGGVFAIIQIASGGTLVFILQGIKLAIHVFGGVTAYLASREPSLVSAAPPWMSP